MKKIILASAALISASMLTANAQTASTDNDPGYTKTSIFVQYGYAPLTSFNGWTKNTFNMYGSATPDVKSLSMGSGAITAGINIAFSDKIELAVPFTYSHNTGEYERTGAAANYTNFTDDWFTITPNAKINWHHSATGKVTLYSRVGLGFGFGSRKHTGNQGVHNDTKPIFTFIAAPIGIEVGKNISFFAEAGFGQTGCISVGLRFRFKKTKQGFESDGTVKKYNWAERYLDKE